MQIYNDGNGLSASITEMVDGVGGRVFGFGRIVDTAEHPFGTASFLRLSNAALWFDLKADTRRAEVEYLYMSGGINLGARSGTDLYTGSMDAMGKRLQINGVTITRSSIKEIRNSDNRKVAEAGVIVFEDRRDIGTLIIGGQELYVDNFCFN